MGGLLHQYEYVLFILMLQALPYFALREEVRQSSMMLRYICTLQVIMICVFYLAWGGYSVDAWRYANGFDKNPLTFQREWLFWSYGALLRQVFLDPWPMKLISATCAGIAASAVVLHLRRHGTVHVVVGLFLLACVPVFIFGFGNVVREGMAAAIMMLAMVFFVRRDTAIFVLLSIAALLVHVSALVLIVAVLLTRVSVVKPIYILVAAPLLGVIVPHGLVMLGLAPASWIPYALEQQGAFHYARFAVSYMTALAVLFIPVDCGERVGSLRLIYVYAVAGSCLLLNYEVPFERLLLLSQAAIPLLIPFYVLKFANRGYALKIGWAAMYAGCALLWTYRSVVNTLGFA